MKPKIIKPVLFVLFCLGIATNQPLFSQATGFRNFEKAFNLKNGLSNDQESIVFHRHNIITANIYGVELFNGLSWKRDRLTKNVDALHYVYKLHKNKDRIYLVGNQFIGEYKIGKTGSYRFKQLISLKNKNTIGYVLDVYDKEGKIFFLGYKGLIILHKGTNKYTKHAIPKMSGYFLSHHLNNEIVINEVGKDTFVWKDQLKKWVKSNKYNFFGNYRIQFAQDIRNKRLFITTKGEVFWGKKTTPIFHKELTRVCKNGYSFKIEVFKNFLYIKQHNKIIVYDTKLDKITPIREMSVRVSDFFVTDAGNVWVTTVGKGVLFIEINSLLRIKSNYDKTYSQSRLKDEVFTEKRGTSELEIKTKKYQKRYKLGKVRSVTQVDSTTFISTEKGIYRKQYEEIAIQKVFEQQSYQVLKAESNKKILVVLHGQGLSTVRKHDFRLISTIKTKEAIKTGIVSQDIVYFSDGRGCFKVKLVEGGQFAGKPKKMMVPAKNYGLYQFLKFDNKVLVHSTSHMFYYDEDETLVNFAQSIKNLPTSTLTQTFAVKFTHIEKINKDSLLVIPVLGGEHEGLNKPGMIIKQHTGHYIWHNKPFLRLDRYEMDSYARTPKDRIQIITPTDIIELTPNKKVNTNYSFKTYIRGVKLKTKQTDTIRQKEILVDSTIYFGNAVISLTPVLAYQHNTLTFIYASDSWAAYERNKYSYQLVGLDDTWSDWSKEQKKEYTHLREGTYTFKVRCRNIYGTTGAIDSYTFTVLPPWHRTTWAYALYILAGFALLLGGSYGYNRYRSRQLRKRNQELEQVVEVRTKEIREQKEEITQQAEELKATNEELKQANEFIKQEKDEKVKIYLQEATDAVSKLQQIRNTLATKGADTAEKMLNAEINTAGEMALVREKVRNEYPEFVETLDQALASKHITKLMWQVGYCLKLEMSPVEVSKILPTTNRTVSVHGSKLRKLGILDPIKK